MEYIMEYIILCIIIMFLFLFLLLSFRNQLIFIHTPTEKKNETNFL